MKALASKIRTYWRVYIQLTKITVAALLEYRFDVVIRALYAISYLLGGLFTITIVFSHTTSLAGYNQTEILLFFCSLMTMLALMEMTFFDGFKFLMLQDVATGQFDSVLTKPINPIFLSGFSKPRVEALVYFMGMFSFLIWLMITNHSLITPLSLGTYILFMMLGLYIHFLVVSCYASLAFFMTRSAQTLRFVQSLSDNTYYPLTMYPKAAGLVLLTLIPSAFAAYIPVSFLVGKGTWLMAIAPLIVIIGATVVQQSMWRIGLRHYSSASS